MVPQSPRPHCSRCGSLEDLHLVTVQMCGPDVPGRALVYCPKCRGELAPMLGVDQPLSEVDVEVFIGLYQDGKTSSYPKTASEIVLD